MIHRRHLLQSLACGGFGLGAIGWRGALAMNEEAPKRMILINHNHGVPYDGWKIHPPEFSTSNDWELDLSNLQEESFGQCLSPLYEHRNRLIALDGLSLSTAELDMDGFRHETGWIQSWTGNWVSLKSDGFSGSDGLGASSASLDQLIASEISRPDRLPSIEMMVNGSAEEGRSLSYGVNGRQVPLESSPLRLWNRIFGPSVSPDPLLSRHQLALDFAFGEYNEIKSQLGQTKRQKLSAHFELVHSLSQRLQGMATLSCPSLPEMSETYNNYDDTFDAFSELVAASFSCDVTRVATMSLGCMPTSDFGWDHFTDDVHKGLAHEIYNSPECHQAMIDYLNRHAQQIARLVSLLESIPDSDGRSNMDNTLIVWGSELADGWHGYLNYCPVIIGGEWYFRTGRYMHWARKTPIQMFVPDGTYTQTCGMPHQHFLVSAAHAMGVHTESVGIKNVQSQNGDFVDCTGPLPNLV